MALRDYTRLRPAGDIGNAGLTNNIIYNLEGYWNWALLGRGNYVNVNIPNSGLYGGDFHALKPVVDEAYDDGQVWQSIRKQWVWETGVEFNGTQPTEISGVYINGTFYLPNDATYGHSINYELGRIIFDSGISTESEVTLNYSYKYCQIYVADTIDVLEEVQFYSTNPADTHYNQQASGDFVEQNHHVQLPCIIIEDSTRGKKRGYQLGDGSIIVYPEILFHVFSESKLERNKIMDLIDLNVPKTLLMFNVDSVISNNDLPLNFDGTLNSGALMYPELVENYLSQQLILSDSEITAKQTHSRRFHTGVVRVKCEVINQDSV